MPKYALLKDGVFQKAVMADADWTPPEGHTKVLFDPAVHRPPEAPETERWIPSFRFLFELHSTQQQVLMDAVHSDALSLSPAELLSPDETLLSANGFPVPALRVIRLGYEMMDKLGGKVDLLSPQMGSLFTAMSALGIYGTDPAGIAAEIARVTSNVEPT